MPIYYIVNARYPYARILEVECEIKAKSKAWVVLKNGETKLIGSTAFPTESAAIKNKKARLRDRERELRKFKNNRMLGLMYHKIVKELEFMENSK